MFRNLTKTHNLQAQERTFVAASLLYMFFFLASSMGISLLSVKLLKSMHYPMQTVTNILPILALPLEIILHFRLSVQYTNALATTGRLNDSTVWQVCTLCLIRCLSLVAVMSWCEMSGISDIVYKSFLSTATIFGCFAALGFVINYSFLGYAIAAFIALSTVELAMHLMTWLLGWHFGQMYHYLNLVIVLVSGFFVTNEITTLRRYYVNHGMNNLVAFISGYMLFDRFVFIFIRLLLANVRNKKRDE